DVVFADLFDGQNLIDHQPLRDDRLEFVVDQAHRIDLAVGVALDDALGKYAHVLEFQLAHDADVLADDLHRSGARLLVRLRHRETPAQHIAALAPESLDVDVLPGFRIQEAHGRFRDI